MSDDDQTVRDRALARLDEKEIKARLVLAFDRFLELGFAVHLIAVRGHRLVEYTLALYPDGTESVDSARLQEIADEFRLDYTIERESSVDGWLVVFYPRW